jgi:transcriptional regulator with XRE-family HTH domain
LERRAPSLAERTGIHATAIGRLERGTREPRLKTILRLADGLRTQPGRLLNYLGERRLTRKSSSSTSETFLPTARARKQLSVVLTAIEFVRARQRGEYFAVEVLNMAYIEIKKAGAGTA